MTCLIKPFISPLPHFFKVGTRSLQFTTSTAFDVSQKFCGTFISLLVEGKIVFFLISSLTQSCFRNELFNLHGFVYLLEITVYCKILLSLPCVHIEYVK